MTHINPQPVFSCQQLEKRFFGVPVLKQMSFELAKGEVLGLVGENGAGKSTLMNLIGGVLPADAGEMVLEGEPYRPHNPSDAVNAGVAFIHQELNLFTNLSIAENIFIPNYPVKRWFGATWIDRKAMTDKTNELLSMIELSASPDTRVEDLSPGERQLVEIAKALSIDAKLIIFDEPTTSLTSRERQKLFQLIKQLASKGISIIYISHALNDVLHLCDQLLILRDGENVCEGPVSDFDSSVIVTKMVGREINRLFPESTSQSTQRPALTVSKLTQPYTINDVSFTLYEGEILGVAGLMGSGRTELARILFGLDPHETGEIQAGDTKIQKNCISSRVNHGLAFLTENRREEGLMMDASIQENMALASLPSYQKSLTLINDKTHASDIDRIAVRVQLKHSSLSKQAVKTLSGGNQQKAVLAKWLLNNPDILILDEPTRGIDVGAKYEIYCIMQQHVKDGGSVLFISSEIEELMGMCDRILIMHKGQIQCEVKRESFDREEILAAALGES